MITFLIIAFAAVAVVSFKFGKRKGKEQITEPVLTVIFNGESPTEYQSPIIDLMPTGSYTLLQGEKGNVMIEHSDKPVETNDICTAYEHLRGIELLNAASECSASHVAMTHKATFDKWAATLPSGSL